MSRQQLEPWHSSFNDPVRRSMTLPMPKLSYISPKATVQASSIHGGDLFAIAPIVKVGFIFTRDILDAMPERCHNTPCVVPTLVVSISDIDGRRRSLAIL